MLNLKITFKLFFILISQIFYLSCVHSQSSLSNQNNTSEFQKKLDMSIKNAQKLKSFKVSFEQENYSYLRNKKSTSNGLLYISKPASFRFEITHPRSELYISNGLDFWKYIPKFKHAQHLKSQLKEIGFIDLLTNPSNLNKHYEILPWVDDNAKKVSQDANISALESDAPPAANKEFIHLKLLPKGDKQQKVLYAIIQVKTGFVKELRIVQLNGNRTRLVFSNHESKKPPSKKLFHFSPPQGIVVDKL